MSLFCVAVACAQSRNISNLHRDYKRTEWALKENLLGANNGKISLARIFTRSIKLRK